MFRSRVERSAGGDIWRREAALVGMAAVLVLSACGSTVQWTDTIVDGGSGGVADDGLSIGDRRLDAKDASPGTTRTKDVSPGTLSRSDALGDQTRALQPGIPQDRTTGVAPLPSGASGRGFTAKQLYVGVGHADGASESVAAAFGVERGSAQRMAKAIVDDINARGGIAGREVAPVFYEFQQGNPNREAQAACAWWTEDRPVFAATTSVGTIYSDELLNSCLAKRQTPLLQTLTAFRPQRVYSRYAPYLYAPTEPTLERVVRVTTQRAAANGYFEGGWDADPTKPGSQPTKIGILSRRAYYGSDHTRVVRQELGRQSQPVAATFEWSGDLARAGDEMNQAIVSFKEADVTHVIAQDVGLFMFSLNAESQQYRPRYLVSSDHLPGSLQDLVPPEQMVGALGTGHLPASDVDQFRDPGDVSAETTRCRKVMDQAGQNTSNRIDWALMVNWCSAFNFLASAVAEGGLSPAGVRRAVSEMGSMPSAATFRASFAGDRFAGAAAARDLGFRESCKDRPADHPGCFVYLSSKNHGM